MTPAADRRRRAAVLTEAQSPGTSERFKSVPVPGGRATVSPRQLPGYTASLAQWHPGMPLSRLGAASAASGFHCDLCYFTVTAAAAARH